MLQKSLRQGMYYFKNTVSALFNIMYVSCGNSARVRHKSDSCGHAALTNIFCRLAQQIRKHDVRAYPHPHKNLLRSKFTGTDKDAGQKTWCGKEGIQTCEPSASQRHRAIADALLVSRRKLLAPLRTRQLLARCRAVHTPLHTNCQGSWHNEAPQPLCSDGSFGYNAFVILLRCQKANYRFC